MGVGAVVIDHSFMGTDTMCSASVRGTGDNAHGVGVLQRMSRTHILFLHKKLITSEILDIGGQV